jgi:hypothetical protein
MTALPTRWPVSPRRDARRLTPRGTKNRVAPIVAAIDGSPAGWHASDAAVRLAVELNAPLTLSMSAAARRASSERLCSSAV